MVAYWSEVARHQYADRPDEYRAALEEASGGRPFESKPPNSPLRMRCGDTIDELDQLTASDRSPIRHSPVIVLRCRIERSPDEPAAYCDGHWHFRRREIRPGSWGWSAFARCSIGAGENAIRARHANERGVAA